MIMSNIIHTSNVNIFVSYTESDKERFNIPEFIKIIKTYPGISDVYSCDDTRDGSLLHCFNISNLIEKADYCVFFCCNNTYNSAEVCTEAKLALELNKAIIPVFESFQDIIPAFRHNLGVRISKNDLNPEMIAKQIVELINNGKKAN